MNLKNLPPDNNSQPMRGNFPLARQSSVYSLTLEEFQNTMGGFGKDFGSMNMDEFLKNIWCAEETQAMAASSFGTVERSNGGNIQGQFSLQRQGSLTLPRTLSQKTVDEVWRDIFKESSKDVNGNVGSNLQQRQQTLGEMTLEEFLLRAGVVREDTQSNFPMNNNRFYGDFGGDLDLKNNAQAYANNTGLALGFAQSNRDNEMFSGMTRQGVRETNTLPLQQHQGGWLNNQYRTSVAQQPKQQPHEVFPNQSVLGYASSMQLTNNVELTNSGAGSGLTLARNGGSALGIVGIRESTAPPVGNGLVRSGLHGGTGMGLASLGAAAITVAAGSPANNLSSDGLGKSNGDNSSLSPVPYVFSGGLRGRKCSGTVEKVVERRQRRMIKNRESAARSRARKQAYTMELEAEVEKLKEEKTELQKKQAEIMEIQKNQILEMVNQQYGSKRLCLRRTQTGPW